MQHWRWLPLAALALLTSCGGEEETNGGTTTPPGDCPLPSRWSADGECRAPGEQEDGCPAGTAGQDDGSCLPAGIPPDACLAGFAHDGDVCEPILPAAVCPAGEMAVMGETTCRPVMPCGSGAWGDLPVDDDTTYVDQGYVGGSSDGSAQHPWTTVGDGVQAAPAGGLVAVAAGSYVEDVEISNKAVRLWGVCPAQVELVGVGDYAALSLRYLTEPAEVGGLAVTGAGMGIIMMAVADVRVDRVWIHDTARRGLEAEDTFGPATMTVRGSLIEGVQLLGLSVFGASADVQDTVVRGTIPRSSDGSSGTGVAAFPGPDSGARTDLVLRNVLVELNHQ
ncbi:MAG: hypothetical protein JRI68_30765, partial [Deltaproteobacteria bacterium]|nr:hypothetical protein [Deltaproteobacteria bacterium]